MRKLQRPKIGLHLKVRKIKHFPGIFLAVVLLGLLTYLLGWSTLLAARTVVVDGTQRSAEINGQILNSVSNFHIGEPLARVDVHSLTRKISLLDWVDKASVKRDWLHGRIHIVIQERNPIAQFVDSSGSLKLIDKSGVVFASKGGGKYPLISFASANPELISSVAIFVQALHPDLIENLESLAIRSTEYIQSRHTGLGSGHLIIRWGDNSEMSTKDKVLRALLALPENQKAKLIDLSSPLSPIVK